LANQIYTTVRSVEIVQNQTNFVSPDDNMRAENEEVTTLPPSNTTVG